VRLVVEPNSNGFLYVFNTTDDGPPRMIFPDPKLNGGANRVRAHAAYEIPSSAASDERLQWFTFHSKAGIERLYVIVTRAPLKGIPVGAPLVARCRTAGQCPVRPSSSTWGTITAALNAGTVDERKAVQYGQPLTPSERLALAERDLSLAPDAPEPSVIRIDATSRAGMVVVAVDLQHE
jgi:hypothetical protein